SGRSTRPSRSSMVLLPDPLAPVSATHTPAGTSNEGTSSRKLSAPAPRRRLIPCKLSTLRNARFRFLPREHLRERGRLGGGRRCGGDRRSRQRARPLSDVAPASRRRFVTSP